jgi:uncharacterized protein YecE (DUF72 family)
MIVKIHVKDNIRRRALEVLVGTGGWDYFSPTDGDRLRAYSRLFNFVEVNSTFYSMPRLGTVRSWRRRAPRGFTFSVKCNRVATHELGLRPAEATFRVLEGMLAVCGLLGSQMLVLQTPPDLKVDEEKVREVSSILKSLNGGRVQVFWEARSLRGAESRSGVETSMLREGLVPVVDLSVDKPVQGSEIVYSRLFSHGALEYGDELIELIDRRASESGAERAVLTFHGAHMYRDAARYIEHKRRDGGSHTTF